MPIYNYQAFDAEGTLHKGSKDAASESEVRQFLRSRELFPKEIRTSRLYKANFGKGRGSGCRGGDISYVSPSRSGGLPVHTTQLWAGAIGV